MKDMEGKIKGEVHTCKDNIIESGIYNEMIQDAEISPVVFIVESNSISRYNPYSMKNYHEVMKHINSNNEFFSIIYNCRKNYYYTFSVLLYRKFCQAYTGILLKHYGIRELTYKERKICDAIGWVYL